MNHKIVQSEKEMKEYAAEFAQELQGGEIVELIGDLGAGKTTFVRGIVEFLGSPARVKSPTFTVMNEYPITSEKIKKIVHLDLYRFENPLELDALELDQYIDPQTVLFVEWPNRFNVPLFDGARRIEIEHLAEGERKIEIK